MSIQPVWIIEAGVFGPNTERLRDSVARQGMECYVISQHTLGNNLELLRCGRALTHEDCVICFSSFPMAHFVQEHREWIPGCWCAFDNLACSTYYAYWGHYLLNEHYTILPVAEAIRQQDFLFEVFGRCGEVFVRPDTAEKLFVGQCICPDEFATTLASSCDTPTEKIVVAAKQPIVREWRLVVIDSQIVAASQYYVRGELTVTPGCPDEVLLFAEEMLQNIRWSPDRAFTLDVCESNGRLSLLEINSLSCAGLYACDLDAIVEAASELARKQRRDYTRQGARYTARTR